MSSHHKNNFGMYGEGIRVCLDGFAYTTAQEWMEARMNWGSSYGDDKESREAQYNRCKELAAQSREAIKSAWKAIANRQKEESST